MNFFDVVNLWGLLFAALLAAPHVLWFKTHSHDVSGFSNRAMVYIDRTGRKALMERFWLITTAVLIAAYLLCWLLLFKTEKKGAALAVTLISAAIVIFSGIMQVKILLVTAGIVYLIGELYMLNQYFRQHH